jgi:tetratricopeptide (TPR) repeat protein
MSNLVPLILIFLSLAVIIFIFARKIPRLRELRSSAQPVKEQRKMSPGIAGKLGVVFGLVLSKIKDLLVLIAEWVIKKIKNILHLVHFWLIKVKRGKGELEARRELFREEEKSLEKVMHEDLAQPRTDFDRELHFHTAEKLSAKESASFKLPEEEPVYEIPRTRNYPEEIKDFEGDLSTGKNFTDKEHPQERKIEQFFTDSEYEPKASVAKRADFSQNDPLVVASQPVIPEEKKSSFFGRFFGKKNKEEDDWKDDIAGEENVESPYSDRYSDGIVRIERRTEEDEEAESRMQAVVTVKKRQVMEESADMDDELGIDKEILERKIIQKIAARPRDVENYRQLGELYIKMKNFQDAEESYKQILKITPRDMDAKRKIEKIKLFKRLQQE